MQAAIDANTYKLHGPAIPLLVTPVVVPKTAAHFEPPPSIHRTGSFGLDAFTPLTNALSEWTRPSVASTLARTPCASSRRRLLSSTVSSFSATTRASLTLPAHDTRSSSSDASAIPAHRWLSSRRILRDRCLSFRLEALRSTICSYESVPKRETTWRWRWTDHVPVCLSHLDHGSGAEHVQDQLGRRASLESSAPRHDFRPR